MTCHLASGYGAEASKHRGKWPISTKFNKPLGTGAATTLELIQYGVTLQGGGAVTLSDSGANVTVGTVGSVTLINLDNTISGAGELGAGR